MSDSSRDQKGSSERQGRNVAEWVSLAISSLLVLVVVGLVVTLWLRPSDEPARFTITPGDTREVEGQHYLSITVSNEGDATAAQVQLEGTVGTGESEETSTTTIDFLPGHADAAATLLFSRAPTDVQLRITSYQEP